MKIFFGLLLGCMSLFSFSQENPILSVDWNDLDAKLSDNSLHYTIEYMEITPGLSFIRQTYTTGNHQLMEINLAIDLRTQYLRKDEAPTLLLPENKFIQSPYTLAIPTTPKSNGRITITGNGGYNNNNSGIGGSSVKNTVYRDASTYTGTFCGATGALLY